MTPDPAYVGPCFCGALDGEPCRTDNHHGSVWRPDVRVVHVTEKAVLVNLVDSLTGFKVWIPKSQFEKLDELELKRWKVREIVERYY